MIFDREVLEEALLFLFFLFFAWNQVQKTLQRKQKMFANKKYYKEKKMFANKICYKSNKKCYKEKGKCSKMKIAPN